MRVGGQDPACVPALRAGGVGPRLPQVQSPSPVLWAQCGPCCAEGWPGKLQGLQDTECKQALLPAVSFMEAMLVALAVP